MRGLISDVLAKTESRDTENVKDEDKESTKDKK